MRTGVEVGLVEDLSAVIAVFGGVVLAVLLFALPSLAPRSATFGQRTVRPSRRQPDGRHPGPQAVPALLAGCSGYYSVLTGLGNIVSGAGALSFMLLVASVVLAWRPRSHRGLSGLASGLIRPVES